MMLYITTSRKPSLLSRRLAKQLARVLGGESENRGKRSVSETLQRAQTKGFCRCMLIYEQHGNPSRLSFLEENKWLPSVKVKSSSFAQEENSKRRLPKLAKITSKGETGKAVAELFETEEIKERMSESASGLEMYCGEGEISFWLEGKKVGPIIKVSGVEMPKEIEAAE